MDDLAAWLLERIAEDEAAARAATAGPWFVNSDKHGNQIGTDTVRPASIREFDRTCDVISYGYTSDPAPDVDITDAQHIARWNPARVLAECAAKRELIWMANPYDFADDGGTGMSEHADEILRTLALPYADRPGYRQEWAL